MTASPSGHPPAEVVPRATSGGSVGAAGAAGAAGAVASALDLPGVPCLRLRMETLLVNGGETLAPRYHDEEAAVAELWFLYGDARVSATTDPTRSPLIRRDREGEGRARYLLESLGVVEIACLDEIETCPGSSAEYLLRVDRNVHALCSFTAYALPQLRALGWRIEMPPDYPYQVVSTDAPWYAHVGDDDRPGWFSLELGIEVGGRHVNLLPALLQLLQEIPPAARLERLMPPGGRLFALPIGDGRYVTVPPERLRILIQVLGELYQGDDAAPDTAPFTPPVFRFPAAQAGSLGMIDAAFAEPGRPALAWSGATALRDRGRALAAGPDGTPATKPPVGLRATLRPYQQEGLRWLQHLRAHDAGGILADDMGLGKTLQTIAHLVAEKEAGRLDLPALIVAPTSVIGNWRRELDRFAPQLRVQLVHGPERRYQWADASRRDVVLTTYPVLVRDEPLLASRQFSLLILDEAQAIKNPRSQAHQAATRVAARHRLCLSGTPIENNLGELWALCEFLNPGLLGDADWFRHRFAHPIERGQDRARLRALRAQVAPFILRRTKEEVARDLPPKTEIVRPVELRGAQRDLYESLRVAAHAEVRKVIASKGIGPSTVTILDALMRLRQACCDPRLVRGESASQVRESAKYDLLMELLEQQLAQGRRVLVFSQFARMLALIGAGLDERGTRWVGLTGATTDRQQPVDAFQKRQAEVFLITLKAGGTGLNLTAADTVIHYDPWWNPAAQAQATDRAHRIGQTRPVFVYSLIVAGSVEERMLTLQQKKRQLAAGVLGREEPGDDAAMTGAVTGAMTGAVTGAMTSGATTPHATGSASAALTAREVEGLFAPLSEPAL
jgi:superfamily II DNA or RNA helicase